MERYLETVCHRCGTRAAEIVCHLCKEPRQGLFATEPVQPAPAEAYVDVDDLDDEPDPRWDEDEYLDDPRHGQAAELNRRYE